MKIRWIPVTSFSVLSLCLTALGFGSCQSKKFLQQQEEQRSELHRQLAKIDYEQATSTAKLAQLRDDYENIGRGECVYGGPNNMEEARRAMEQRHAQQEKAIKAMIAEEEQKLDSLYGERQKVERQLGELDNPKKKK